MAMRLFSIRPAMTLRGRTFRGIRGWEGKPTHPPLTDFPIVCYVLAAGFDLLSLVAKDGSSLGRNAFVTATFVTVAGLVVSIGTALTGFWDWWKGLEREKGTGPIGRAQHTQVWRTANWHMTVMLSVTALVAVETIVRVSGFDTTTSTGLPLLVLSIVAGALVAVGAAYGGALVFDYQFNVVPLKGSTVWDETEDDQLPGQRKPPAS
jgi:uncharacterized membrane protein